MNTTNETTTENFDSEVMASNQTVIVDFWAPGCGPCKMLAPLLEEISAEQAGRVKLVKVNLDENPGLGQRFGIQAVPTLLFFHGGEVRQQRVGLASKKRILQDLEEARNS